jgi:hypothetical protein
MNNYQPDPLEKAVWNILNPLINRERAPAEQEGLRIGYQNAGEWGDSYAVMSVVGRQAQGQRETLGFDDVTGVYKYKGQRHGQISVTFHGPQASWRAEDLTSALFTETASDLCNANNVVMYEPQTLDHVPIKDKDKWLDGAAVVINYRCAYIFSDRVEIIEIVNMTATVGDETITKSIEIKTP